MAQRRNHHSQPRKSRGNAAPPPAARQPVIFEKKVPIVYGEPFTLLEDSQRVTFIFKSGQWVSHGKSIASYRVEGQVVELSQKINGMTRYTVTAPVSTAT